MLFRSKAHELVSLSSRGPGYRTWTLASHNVPFGKVMSFTKDRSFYSAYRTFQRCTNANPVYSTPFSGSSLIQRTRTGESNPNWRTQVKRQENATTDMSGTFDTLLIGSGSANLTWKGYFGPNPQPIDTCDVTGNILAYLATIDWVPSITTNVADNRALIAYLKDVQTKKSAFKGLTFMGELREAFKMIRRPAVGLRNLCDSWISQVKREKKRVPKQWKKNLSSMWLEQAFGWQPLVSDINSAYHTYKSFHDRKSQVPCSGFGKEEMEVPSRTGYGINAIDSPYSLLNYNWSRVSKEIAIVKYKGMVKLTSTGTLAGSLEPFGFSFNEFIPTAWELLPWSFLIDYFTNIGDVIEAGCVSRGDIAWSNKTVITVQVKEITSSIWTNETNQFVGDNYISSFGTPVAHKATRRRVERLTFTPLGIPTFTFEIPGKPAQWANMLALFSGSNLIHPQRRYSHTLPGFGVHR